MTNRETPDQMAWDGLTGTSQHRFNESSSAPSPTLSRRKSGFLELWSVDNAAV